MKLYPITFKPIYFEKIWGGNRIKSSFKRNVSMNNIGESWEIIDFEERKSEISSGEFEGKPISAIFNDDWMGDFVVSNYNRFPLIIKYLDARQDLSVQVHPKEGDYVKNEIWFFISPPKLGKIICGIDKDYNGKDVLPHLKYISVSKDDFAFIPSGAVHALTAGSFVLEIQQASDTTYRLYDWDRLDDEGKMRKLHLDEASKHIQTHHTDADFIDEIKIVKELSHAKIFCVRKTPHFCIEKIIIHKEADFASLCSSFSILNVVEGQICIETDRDKYPFCCGQTVLIPAKMGEYQISGEAKLIHTFIE